MAVTSALIGITSFSLLLFFVGIEKIIEPFRRFSLFYLALFLATTVLIYLVYSLRWYSVLRYQGVKIPFLELLKLKLIGFTISYLTPVSRMGGEPFRAILFKKKFGLKASHAFSSILIETVLGLSLDFLLVTLALPILILFFDIPLRYTEALMVLSFTGSLLVIVFYWSLFRGLRPVSFIMGRLFPYSDVGFLKKIMDAVKATEDSLIEFMHSGKQGVARGVLISALSWPLLVLEYKFALLAIGVNDVSYIIIILSIIATSVATFIPVPASFGAQEAGHFSVFSLVGIPGVGIALSLLIRFKDLLTVLVGLMLLSHEGLNFFQILKRKNN